MTLPSRSRGTEMTRDARLTTYYWMQLTRMFDERMLALWKQGRGVGGTFSQRGHEAISVGAASALGPDDVVSPMHRDLGAFLLRGLTPREIFGNLLGRQTGITRGRDANLHGMSALDRGIIGFISHLPHSLPVALGVAMSFRYRGEPRVAMAFTGDGATNTGLYHEVLNMASVYCAPLVVVRREQPVRLFDALPGCLPRRQHRRSRGRLRSADDDGRRQRRRSGACGGHGSCSSVPVPAMARV